MAEMSVGKKLKMLRGARSTAEIAELVGISESALKMYELDERAPRDNIKVRLARLYGVSVGSLFFAE